MKIDGRETPLSFEGSVGRKVEYGVRIKRPIYLQILVVQQCAMTNFLLIHLIPCNKLWLSVGQVYTT